MAALKLKQTSYGIPAARNCSFTMSALYGRLMEIRDDEVAEVAKEIDWGHLSAQPDLPREIMDRYEEYIHWDRAIPRLVDDLDLLDEFSTSVDWDVITKHPMLSPQLLTKFENLLSWEHFPYIDYLRNDKYLENEAFLYHLAVSVSWNNDTVRDYLTIDLFRKMVAASDDDVFTDDLVRCSALNEDILIEFPELFDWDEVMDRHELSEAQMRQLWPKWERIHDRYALWAHPRSSDYLFDIAATRILTDDDWACISEMAFIPAAFFRTYARRFVNIPEMLAICPQSEEVIRYILEHGLVNIEDVIYTILGNNEHLSEQFVIDYLQSIDLVYIAKNRKFSEAFLEQFMDVLTLEEIVATQQLSEAFIQKHLPEFSPSTWHLLAQHQQLSIQFIREQRKKLVMSDNIRSSIARSHVAQAFSLRVPGPVALLISAFAQ